tara:strand:- start:1143 stop:4556 length:3414 start_codon:yes stop_codon:yes gene_type:complete
MGYDLEGARKAGISDQEILSTLAEKHNYDLAGARAAGISDDEILNALSTAQAPSEPVVEKESPELMGYLGAGAGAVGAAGDVIYSKGRPLIRMGEKMLGMDTSTPTAKPRTFLDPSTVAQQAISRRMPVDPTTGGAVKTWAETQHAGEFLGGKEYSEADKIKKAAMDFEAKNPGQKVLPGSLLAVPEAEAKNLSQQKAALAAEQDRLNQAEVQKVAQTRAERLGERADLKQKVARKNIASGAGTIATKVGAPILGGYELGSQGAQAYNRLTRPDMTASDVAAGAANVVGAGTGALSMLPGKYRIPAAILAQGAGAVANWLDKRNPRDEEIEKKAAGGKIGALESVAKKVKGFLESTPKKPNELVGTRYKSTDLGGLIEPTPFDIEKVIGAKAIHRPYDLSGRNQLVEEVSGHKLINPVKTEGGQPFGRDISLQATGQGGASNRLINDRILKRVEAAAKEGNGQVFNIPSTMGYGSEAFSTMPIDILLDLIKQRELPPETLQYLSNLVRAKSPNLEKFLGFEHPEVGKQFLEGGYGLTTTPGKLRVGATDVLTGKQNKAQSLLDYNQEDLFNAIRAPELRDVPPGYMGETIMQAQPGHPGFSTGSHSAYDSGDASKYMGQGINAPISVWMPDAYKQALSEVRAAPKTAGNALGHQRAMARNVLGTAEEGVAQTITPQVADNLQRYQEAVKEGKLDKNDLEAIHKYIYGDKAHEYAKGGKVGILEAAAAAFKKQFTPGFYHGSPSNKIKEFDTQAERNPNFLTALEEESNDLAPRGFISLTNTPKFSNDYATGKNATVYPVSANLGKHFDPRLQENYDVFHKYWKGNPESFPNYYGSPASLPKSFREAEWSVMEDPGFLEYLKNKGYNSMTMVENGQPNVGIFDPKHIRGKFAKYNPEDAESPDFMKAAGGAVEGYAPGGKVVRSGLTELMDLIKNQGGSGAAQRLERAADLVPNLEHQYQPQALKEAFSGNRSLVSVMNPADFEKYAAPISSETKSSLSKSRRIGEPGPGQDYTHMPLGTYDDYIKYLQQFSEPGGGGFRSMPYLQLGQRKGFSFPNIQGHEGRHRTDALTRQGNQSTLVGIEPRPELRELPRRSQEEYLNALAKEVGGKSPFVMPQESEVKRGLIELPEMFKKGGKV